MTAAIIGTNLSYILLTFLPPLIWLAFYLREDCHPEPKRLLLLAFIGGICSAILALYIEALLIGKGGVFAHIFSLETTPFYFFLLIALVEEYMKYFAIKLLILKRTDFNEPVDGMIYMMTAALGFAAIENTLFILPLLQTSIITGIEVATNRFLGANLLHALSSGIVGFFLARSWFSPHRHHFILLGIGIATLLHAEFNYLILVQEEFSQGTFYIIFLLTTMAAMVFIEFERLRNKELKSF